jgi:lambda repressor-like predicted transcriptional regulator
MHPELIRANLRMKGSTPASVADELGTSRTSVARVIDGKSGSARIRAAIVKATGIPESQLWPAKPPTGLRRLKPRAARSTAAQE